MRLDQYLVTLEKFSTRNQAQEAIKDGIVYVNQKQVKKPAFDVTETDTIEVLQVSRYVSRSGEKLAGALKQFHVDPKDKVCLDIGASTGGFTDCLLQNGAAFVYALDVGKDQLVDMLRNHPCVDCREEVNCRYLERDDFDKNIDLVVMDVSFISCTKLMESISKVLDINKEAIILIKPQFEVGKQHLSKHGIVTNKNEVVKAVQMCLDTAKLYHLMPQQLVLSTVKGKEGNQEFLVHLVKDGKSKVFDIKSLVK